MSVRLKQVKFKQKLAQLWLLTEDIVSERTYGERISLSLSSLKITYVTLVWLK